MLTSKEIIYNKCADKMRKGVEKYGEYDPDTDTRDLLEEAIEELLDCVNYIKMHRRKVKKISYLREVELDIVNVIDELMKSKGDRWCEECKGLGYLDYEVCQDCSGSGRRSS